MAEQAPQGNEAEAQAQQEKLKEMMQELGPLIKKLQELMQNPDAKPEEKLKLAKRIQEILEIFKKVMPPEQYAEQFGQVEQFVGQVLGSLEG